MFLESKFRVIAAISRGCDDILSVSEEMGIDPDGMRRVIGGLREKGVVRSDDPFGLEKRPLIGHRVLPGI